MRRPGPDLAVTGLVALVVLGPLLLGTGFWLVGDMVFVPDQPWKSAWLGLDGALPRAVPMDALVSLATYVVPGALVQKALLVGGFLAGGLGAGRLVREQAWFARAAAITLFCWNPWVHERLLIGQWAILLGYLLLPWVALAALRLRRDPTDVAPAAVVLVVSAVCSPSSGVMAVGVLVLLGLTRDRRGWWRAALVAVLANLPWLVPALTADAVDVSTDGVFAGFAARAESGAGTLASLFSLGGIWKTSILAGERTSALLVLLSCLLSVVALVGLWRGAPDRARWLTVGGTALLLALLPTTAAGADLLEQVGEVVPGVALLRDSHRFLAPLGLVLAVGAAHAATQLRAAIRPGRGALWSAVGLLVAAPVLLLPSLAWGGGGEIERSSYPQAWADVADLVGPDELTVVLPWAGSYRGFDWNHRRAVLDPAPRLLPGTVLVDDSVRLTDRVVPPEDPRVVAVAGALEADDPAAALRDLGVRWVLVERGMGDVEVPAAEVRYDAGGLTLLDLAADGPVATGATPARPALARWQEILVSFGHGLAILLLLVGATGILRPGSNGRHTT
ncbi:MULTISPECIES: hypothetical protein [unclassified Nocardioides]|uniref:hypothetical protein n=1 Tax=unclassified Nocardioides TaxID=2615069 RepID=UPI0007023E00|nr:MULTISPECIES: hypothetical protein [unclassified Nocardioides]KRC56629.1 hypothetical protein ASE19_01995 [Nocardioides sp. Root79]KRC76840.1 hypothetical protein ASE20_00865 [Nocardioides sp. Root240]